MKKAIQKSLTSPDALLSIVIGFAVVLSVGYAIIANIRLTKQQKQEELKRQQEEQAKAQTKLPATHTTKEGENLWIISETYYKTGYNWVDIASENKLENPDLIFPDQKLTIPDVKPRIVEDGDITATAASTVRPKHTSYTIVEGDTLWDIAIKEYEAGGKWPDIAAKNNIENPDLIYPTTILQLP